ncbi:ribonuclease domain-containing protein [Gordonia sp. PKS22-38]|uniref:Ribonuclease domain-containing protein n=1 Tax=Gordonia prachuapensis TaxID=3115651 RepID=A0ABU7MPB6_9ACTN|nr:ribonuclease domain-containing protein [Gordonia sp. PKS22-38]
MTTGNSATRRRTVWSGLGLLVAVAVIALTWGFTGSDNSGHEQSTGRAAVGTTSAQVPDVPDHVMATMALIDAGDWPEAADAPGTRGGGVFRNNEGLLPDFDSQGRPISYQEWDVNPKEPGQSRDAERIVTGSDGSAWYTDDHYRSFVPIRGPDQ